MSHVLDRELWFPPLESAHESGLLAIGGDLSPERLLLAYSLGVFPWYNPGEPILWWSPDPRCVLFPDEFHISRSLRRLLRKHPYRLSLNEDFAAVVYWCRRLRAGPGGHGTWITSEMAHAYGRLHELGFAHSIECWNGETLVGGLYGVCIGRCFFGESMFSRQNNTSKIVLTYLMDYLRDRQFELLDCQQTTDHLLSLGAREVSRPEFTEHLQQAAVPPHGPLISCF
ncbi:MAG: leucyl/phenylalanyl-tRNA--protein transferase [Pelovirga sp.]